MTDEFQSPHHPASLTLIRDLYAYNAWANARVIATAAEVDTEQFTADVAGVGSLRDILVHTASAQWTWLERWRGTSRPTPWDPAGFPDLATLRTRWAEVEAETAAYVSSLTPSDLDRVVSYVNYQGETWAYSLQAQVLHQVNHATQHRSEAALLLTQAGVSPGGLDFLLYFDERQPR